MATNLKKFVNPKFTRTVALGPMRRLLKRHRKALRGFSMKVLDGDAAAARQAIEDFFAGPEGDFPEGLVADLHRIAALGTRRGLDLLLAEGRRHGIDFVCSPGIDPAREDPKHVALTAFLNFPGIFDAAADKLAYFSSTAIAEFDAAVSGIPPQLDDDKRAAFKAAVGALFQADLHGHFCRIGWYEDGDETILAVTHGTPITTTMTVDKGREQALCYRAVETAFLAYSPVEGRLKLRRVAKMRRGPLAEAFALHVLGRPGFFAGADAQDLYTLDPIERAWPKFRFSHGHDPQIRRVRIVEVQTDRVSLDLFGEPNVVEWSVVVRDNHDCALARLREMCPDVDFGTGDWRIAQVRLRIDIEAGRPRSVPVFVKVQPKSEVSFRRDRFEEQIMQLLRRNGFCRDRDADRAPLAAE
jgi:hypothetical protein